MRKKRYDIVVVGCGPGGAIAGKFATLNGAETLIVEEKRQIGFPVYDSMGIIYSQSEMEEVTGEKIEPAMIYSKAGGLAYISPSGKRGKPQLLPDGIFVNRQLFEKSLAIGAVRAGAEMMLHTRVVGLVKEQGVVKGVVIRDGSQLTTIPCSVVIAADGGYQQMARLAGIKLTRANVSASMGCEFAGVKSLTGPHNIDEIYLDDSEAHMYRHAVPYGGDRFSIGVSVGRIATKQKRSLKRGFDNFIKHLEAIGKYDFTKASPVNMMSGGGGTAVAPKLASGGIILIGNGAGAPMWGSRWGGRGVMLGACWTGRVASGIAAEAVKKGDASEKSLNGPYKAVIDESLKGQGPSLQEAAELWRLIFTLSPEEQEQAMEEIGGGVAALHFYSRGALPLRASLVTVQSWLKKRRVRIG